MAVTAGGARATSISLMLALVACTGSDPVEQSPSVVSSASPDGQAVRYRVDFARRAGLADGIVRVDPSSHRVCLALRARPPKGAHLHRRAGPGADDLLVTFFEPPEPGKRRACVDGAGSWTSDLAAGDAGGVYVDLHYDGRGGSVVGRVSRFD